MADKKKTDQEIVEEAMSDPNVDVIAPQPGPQADFLSCPADICIYGGAAGGGKTWGGLMVPLEFIHMKEFRGIAFRRETTDITKPGALLDESRKIYSLPLVGGKINENSLQWKFPSGAVMALSHLQHPKNIADHLGAQYAYVFFDEINTFTEEMFWALMARLRTMCPGLRPFLRATCNPDPDSFIRDMIDWWIDEHGYAIKERSGIIRYFLKDMETDSLQWGDTREEVMDWFRKSYPDEKHIPEPMSFTFIPASLDDNPALTDNDPTYYTKLFNTGKVNRERFLKGNWNIRAGKGDFFSPEWCKYIDSNEVEQQFVQRDELPAGLTLCRGWDLASTELKRGKDPDWTCGTLMGKDPKTGLFYIIDHKFVRLPVTGVLELLRETAENDPKGTVVSIPNDPGSGGNFAVDTVVKALAGFTVHDSYESGEKSKRLMPFTTQAFKGNVRIVEDVGCRIPWNQRYFSVMGSYPEVRHDDDIDSTSRTFNYLTGRSTSNIWGGLA